jgi:putative MATE family efflux protein
MPMIRDQLSRLRAGWREVRAVVRLSLSGAPQDYTQGPVRRAAILLAIPMMLEMAMESLFTIVDIFFVAGLGAAAVAVVGLTEAVLTLVYALGLGLGMGATALVARRIGEHDVDGARLVAAQALWVGGLVALALGIGGALFARDILKGMGAAPDVIAEGSGYTLVMLAGSGTISSLFLINGVFRGAGDATIAMRSMWLANGINIVLDPCLIFGWGPFPELGVTGAAVATTIGRGTGVLYQLACLAGPRSRVPLARRHLRPVPRIIGALLRVSLGGVAQFLVATSSWVVLMRFIAPYGSAAVAGYTIAIRILAFSLLPAWGLANAAATLVGQNLGAKAPARAEHSVWQVAKFSATVMAGVAVLSFAFAPAIIGVFTADAAVLAHGVTCLRIVACGYSFYAVGMIVSQAFNGAGDTTTPTLINLVGFWVLQIPLAWALTRHTALGSTGVYVAVLCAESFIAWLSVVVFRRGRWKLQRL